MRRYCISGRVFYAGPDLFTAAAHARCSEPARPGELEVMSDNASSSREARLRVFELVVALAGEIRRRGDLVEDVEVE